jgi:hypothetical protein
MDTHPVMTDAELAEACRRLDEAHDRRIADGEICGHCGFNIAEAAARWARHAAV